MLGALIGAGVSAAAGLLGKKKDADTSKASAKFNYKTQKEFAQHGVRWRVQDAKAAGLHPLAALGMQASGYNPVSYGSDFGSAGQDIGRAVEAGLTHGERQGNQANIQGVSGKLATLGLERAQLQNDYLRAQIAKLNQAGQPPARPVVGSDGFMPGQGSVPGLITTQPFERAASVPGSSHEPAAVPERGYVWTGTGMAPVKSKEATERLEDDFVGNAMWQWRNNALPFLGVRQMPPPESKEMIERGEKWVYYPPAFEYRRMKPRLGGWVHW